MTIEYLATEAPPRRRWSWVTGVAIALVVALAGGLLLWSERTKSDANDSISAAVFQAQERARTGEGRTLSTLAYASPLIFSTEVSSTVQSGLWSLVEQSAVEAAAGLTELANSVSDVRLLPWQRAQQDARESALGFILAERARFDRIAADGHQIGRVMAEERPSLDDVLAALRASGADDDAGR